MNESAGERGLFGPVFAFSLFLFESSVLEECPNKGGFKIKKSLPSLTLSPYACGPLCASLLSVGWLKRAEFGSSLPETKVKAMRRTSRNHRASCDHRSVASDWPRPAAVPLAEDERGLPSSRRRRPCAHREQMDPAQTQSVKISAHKAWALLRPTAALRNKKNKQN